MEYYNKLKDIVHLEDEDYIYYKLRKARENSKEAFYEEIALLFLYAPEISEIAIIGPSEYVACNVLEQIKKYVLLHKPSLPLYVTTKRCLKSKPDGVNFKTIKAWPAGVNNMRGVTSNLLIVEEAAFINEEIYKKIIAPLLQLTKMRIYLD